MALVLLAVDVMGRVRGRVGHGGVVRWTAYYRDIRGRERSAGTFGCRREAVQAWRRVEAKVGEGRFVDVRSGRQTFERYVTQVWLPGHPMEASTRQGYTQIVEKYLELPPFAGHLRCGVSGLGLTQCVGLQT